MFLIHHVTITLSALRYVPDKDIRVFSYVLNLESNAEDKQTMVYREVERRDIYPD